MAKETHREPLIHITKNDNVPMLKGWAIRGICIIAALLVSAVVIVIITGLNPIEVYAQMFKGSFGTSRKVWTMLKEVSVLLLISLAVTPAFKMRFWNIGAEGQVLMGALASAAVMLTIGKSVSSSVLVIILSLLASVVVGGIWGIIPAVFKAKWNTNETLFTLMLNYIATQIICYAICFWENPKGSNKVGIINPSTNVGWLPSVFNQQYFVTIFCVVLITVIMYVYLKYSKHGYEIAVVGESENTARYIGISVKKVIIRTMALSGALCGLSGFFIVNGIDHTISTTSAGGMGFTAIMVSWLAKFNPIVMSLTSFLLVFLDRGAGEIATAFRLNDSVSDILSGIILFFIIGSEFFINYKISFRKHK